MKILREKIFFDYKKYAEKHGEEAAKDLKSVRDMYASLARDMRRSIDYDPNDIDGAAYWVGRGKKLSKGTKKALKEVKEDADDIRAVKKFKTTRNLKTAGKIGAGVLGTAALGTVGYAAYKHYKNKKSDKKDKN